MGSMELSMIGHFLIKKILHKTKCSLGFLSLALFLVNVFPTKILLENQSLTEDLSTAFY